MQERLVPERMLSTREGETVLSDVVSVVAYPPGQHPERCPLVSAMTVVRVETAAGGVRWFGTEDAWIGSDLRMHLLVNPLDEVRMGWETP